MKIGIVLSNSPSYSETFFRSKIQGLQQSGFDVTLFVQKSNPDFNVCPVVVAPKVHKHNPVLQFFKMSFLLLSFILRFPKRFIKFISLERQAKRSGFQIIKNVYNNAHLLRSDMDWLHFGFATMAIQSESVANAIGAKMAVSFRGYDMDVYPEKHPHCYDLLWAQVDKVHSISRYLLKKAYQLGLSPQKPFRIITPAIDVSLFSRDNHPFSKGEIKLVTVARLHPIKDLKSTIEAMSILVANLIDFDYQIIGDGSEHEVLQAQINTLKLDSVVRLAGKKSHSEVVNILKQADIYVQYSISEGFCNAVLEAQSVGLLCVVSDGGALSENVLHEQTGWVVPKKNPALLAQAIMNVILLPDATKKQISEAAHERAKNAFNLNKQQKLFKEFYED